MGAHRVGGVILKRGIRLVALFCMVGLVALVAGICLADRLIFFPPEKTPTEAGSIRVIAFPKIGDLAVLTALASNPEAYVVLYSHGNAEDLGMLEFYLEEFARRGWSLVAYDYEGYGASAPGHPTEGKTYRDILAVYQWLTRTLMIPPEKIVVYGRSVGSGPSCWLAANEKVGGLILESPFLSVFQVVLPFTLPFDRFPNDAVIGKVRCPVLIIHGTRDEVVPFHHGKRLFELVKAPKQFLRVEGAGHNNLRESIPETYWEELRNFRTLMESAR